MSVDQELEIILGKWKKNDAVPLVPSTKLGELNIDSLDLVEVMFEIEEKFDVSLMQSHQDARQASFADLVGWIEEQLALQRSTVAARYLRERYEDNPRHERPVRRIRGIRLASEKQFFVAPWVLLGLRLDVEHRQRFSQLLALSEVRRPVTVVAATVEAQTLAGEQSVGDHGNGHLRDRRQGAVRTRDRKFESGFWHTFP